MCYYSTLFNSTRQRYTNVDIDKQIYTDIYTDIYRYIQNHSIYCNHVFDSILYIVRPKR